MNREDDLKNLWAELRATDSVNEESSEEIKEEPAPKETIELDSLLSRLEDVVSRLEEALGKKEEEDKEEKADEEPKVEEAYVPRRIRRPLKGRE